MTFKSPRAHPRPFLLMFSALGVLASTACEHLTPPTPGALQATIPAKISQACPRPDRPKAPSIGDLASFSIEQEAAISVCDTRRAAAVSIIELQNKTSAAVAAAMKPKHWWWPF
jgi:hypothetical protein